MSRRLIALLILTVTVLTACGRVQSTRPASAGYLLFLEEGYSDGGQQVTVRDSATGNIARQLPIGTAASDWSRYPLGTRFRIVTTNEEYIIDDYGVALIGTDTIDLYKSSRLDMKQWGVRHVDLDILQWGSEEESLKVLAPRCKNHCVRQMVSALEKKRGKTVAQQTTRLRSL